MRLTGDHGNLGSVDITTDFRKPKWDVPELGPEVYQLLVTRRYRLDEHMDCVSPGVSLLEKSEPEPLLQRNPGKIYETLK